MLLTRRGILWLALVAPLFMGGRQSSSVTAAASSSSLFQLLDTNHDNSIDQQELQIGLNKWEKFVQQTITTTGEPLSFTNYFSFQQNMKGFTQAFSKSFMMIVATEIGDKTFFIAAILSMKFARWAVLIGALTALVVMTILSVAMGMILPQLVSATYTHLLGGALFIYFGLKLLWDSREMQYGKASDELNEVEDELQYTSKKGDGDEEAPLSSSAASSYTLHKPSIAAVTWQALSLTFLAEWGDRSQIATIALSAHQNALGVTLGGCMGHALCTGIAVLGGRILASRISEKTVSIGGGILFLLFGIHSIFFEE